MDSCNLRGNSPLIKRIVCIVEWCIWFYCTWVVLIRYFLLSSGVTGGGGGQQGGSVPWLFSQGNFCRPTGKKQARKKEKMERKGRKIWKGRGGKLKLEGFTFLKHWNLFGSTKGFLSGKIIFRAGKKSGKLTLPPLKNIPLTPLLLRFWHKWECWKWERIEVWKWVIW